MSNTQVGNQAEDAACDYLKDLGYKIIDRNFRIRGGEIDIIAQDKDELVFVEVKARFSHKYGLPEEAITYWKIKYLLKTAAFYLLKVNWGDKPYRLDALTLDYSFSKENPKIELFKNITM